MEKSYIPEDHLRKIEKRALDRAGKKVVRDTLKAGFIQEPMVLRELRAFRSMPGWAKELVEKLRDVGSRDAGAILHAIRRHQVSIIRAEVRRMGYEIPAAWDDLGMPVVPDEGDGEAA